ncbi:MAG: hypothetical protein M0P39_00930 [Rhodocyclaceae bacterium]|nr:hypothetical protein [Rhodocyclaceae bacterium]
MPTAPYDHPLNLTTQAVLTYGSWALTVVLLTIAVKKDVRYRSPFFTFLILAGMVGALAEPLYDVGFMLLFYVPGIWSTFSAFGIPQPVWAYSGYVVLYTGTAMFICEQIRSGLTPRGLYAWAGIELLMSMTFEIVGIQGGAYTYWGPHAFRIFDYPLAIGVLESAQVICFSLAAAELRRRTSSTAALLGLFALFPCTFYLANFGAGAPLIISLHLDNPSPTLVTICSAISIFFALLLIHGATKLLPRPTAC